MILVFLLVALPDHLLPSEQNQVDQGRSGVANVAIDQAEFRMRVDVTTTTVGDAAGMCRDGESSATVDIAQGNAGPDRAMSAFTHAIFADQIALLGARVDYTKVADKDFALRRTESSRRLHRHAIRRRGVPHRPGSSCRPCTDTHTPRSFGSSDPALSFSPVRRRLKAGGWPRANNETAAAADHPCRSSVENP